MDTMSLSWKHFAQLFSVVARLRGGGCIGVVLMLKILLVNVYKHYTP